MSFAVCLYRIQIMYILLLIRESWLLLIVLELKMKIFLKSVIAVLTLTIGGVLGIYLLDWSELWKVALFYLACWGIGHIVYSILRVVDKLYGNEEYKD